MSHRTGNEGVGGLRARLAALDSALLSDVLDESGFTAQILSNRLSSLVAGKRFVGQAVCVQGERRVATQTVPPADAFATPYALATAASPGSVLVVSTGGFRDGAIIGGMLARDLRAQGAEALVTDGCIRDRVEIDALGLPVVCAGITPINSARRWVIVSTTLPVALAGQHGDVVKIAPGDWLVGDDDGVVVVPQAIAAAVADMAEELARREQAIESARDTATIFEQSRARKARFSHVRWLRR